MHVESWNSPLFVAKYIVLKTKLKLKMVEIVRYSKSYARKTKYPGKFGGVTAMVASTVYGGHHG